MDVRSVSTRVRAAEKHLRELGVNKMVLFGAILHRELPPGSPLDFLVELHPPLTYERFLALRDFLQEILVCPVEPVFESIHHHEVWHLIKDEAVILLE